MGGQRILDINESSGQIKRGDEGQMKKLLEGGILSDQLAARKVQICGEWLGN